MLVAHAQGISRAARTSSCASQSLSVFLERVMLAMGTMVASASSEASSAKRGAGWLCWEPSLQQEEQLQEE